MIKLNDKYSITVSGDGYALNVKTIAKHTKDDKKGKYKAGDKYAKTTPIKYATQLHGILRIYIEEAIKDEISDNIMDIRGLTKMLREINEQIKMLYIQSNLQEHGKKDSNGI